jgi:ABC-2 type transport system ATP-binding protein
MLEIRSLTKRFDGVPVVTDVTFSVRPGEIVGFLGPNGAGKSTTVKMIIGLLEPNAGQILFHGRSVLEDPPAFQRKIGYVPEEPNLYPHLSGREYLQLVGRLRGIPRDVLEPKIDEFLRLLLLWDDCHVPVISYSKGMRQKILLSAALLHNPELLILDEPFSGLDVTTALLLRDLLHGFAAQGRMIFYSSHILEVVEKICSRVLIVHKGRIVADDSIQNLRDLIHQPDLEGIFAQLTEQQKTENRAQRILDVMSA